MNKYVNIMQCMLRYKDGNSEKRRVISLNSLGHEHRAKQLHSEIKIKTFITKIAICLKMLAYKLQ